MKLTNLGKSSDPYLTDFNLLKEKSWKIAISINRKIVTLTHNKRLLYRMLNAAGVFPQFDGYTLFFIFKK